MSDLNENLLQLIAESANVDRNAASAIAVNLMYYLMANVSEDCSSEIENFFQSDTSPAPEEEQDALSDI